MTVTQNQPSLVRPRADDPGRWEAFLPSPCVQNHAASIMLLKSGDLACAWFGGSQEGAADISIYFSRLAKGSREWSTAIKLSDDPTRSEQNPVLFPTPYGRLWLLYTAQKAGNQNTAIVRRRISDDDGHSWGAIETLFDTTGTVGTYVRQPLAILTNGDWVLPVFYCKVAPGRRWTGDDDTSGVKISTDQGTTWSEYEVPSSTGCVHMNIEQLGDGSLLALFRSRWADNIYASRSTDDGRTWTEPTPTELPNNNSSLQMTQLMNGDLALVFNDVRAEKDTERRVSLYDEIEDEEGPATEALASEQDPTKRTAFWGTPRAPLTLAISKDGGQTWPLRRNLEVSDGYCMTNNSKDKRNRELSYPSITQTPDGDLHIAFTYFRQAIKYVRVNAEWVPHE
jgi:predicted neuraminidase